ncbi:cell wall protein DAN4 [Stegastes partitus]|uniref:Cell wall protein DAN4 n=1 Tax=Stegastes partitus TaxID=144197 RepID=A0A9Y4NP83_9TELE|nr:PREDICTED: cell wall protein DAN4-like [Stegastes partitus]
MPLISFFFLGLVVVSVMAQVPTLGEKSITAGPEPPSTTLMTSSTPSTTSTTSTTSNTGTSSPISVTNTMSTLSSTSSMNTPNTDRTPLTTKGKSSITPKPNDPGTTTEATTNPKSTTAKPTSGGAGDSIGFIILIIIIIVALAFGVACYVAQKRGRRYSVDFTSRPDEANIPLSTMDPELPLESVPQNGLQTFESIETTEKEPQEAEAKPEEPEEQKAEADKSVVDPSAESVAPAPSADSAEDKPKADVVEQSPAAPAEPSVEEKTDDEGAVSGKTSVESLKETNENNSNNVDLSQKTDMKLSNTFWEVPLNCPV